MIIIEVKSDGRGGAIYTKPTNEKQMKKILLIIDKANKELLKNEQK